MLRLFILCDVPSRKNSSGGSGDFFVRLVKNIRFSFSDSWPINVPVEERKYQIVHYKGQLTVTGEILSNQLLIEEFKAVVSEKIELKYQEMYILKAGLPFLPIKTQFRCKQKT